MARWLEPIISASWIWVIPCSARSSASRSPNADAACTFLGIVRSSVRAGAAMVGSPGNSACSLNTPQVYTCGRDLSPPKSNRAWDFGLDRFRAEGSFDGAHPGDGARAAEGRGGGGAPGRGSGDRARAQRRRPRGLVSFPRGPRALAGHHAVKEPLALPRRLPGGRLGHRLGDAGRGRLLPACRRAALGGLSAVRLCRRGRTREALHGAEAPDGDRARSRGCAAALAGDRVLPRDAPAVARGARVPGEARHRIERGRLPLQARLREPHARLSPPRQEPPRGSRDPGAAAADWSPASLRPRALQWLARDPGLRSRGRGNGGLRP